MVQLHVLVLSKYLLKIHCQTSKTCIMCIAYFHAFNKFFFSFLVHVGEIKTLMIQLLRAVAHLHDNWILHRDLKASNLLLSNKGILKVCQQQRIPNQLNRYKVNCNIKMAFESSILVHKHLEMRYVDEPIYLRAQHQLFNLPAKWQVKT